MSIVYAASGMGITGMGPANVLISLWVENVITNNTGLVTQIYNWWSVLTCGTIAWSAGQRDARFMTILTCVWAAFCMMAGWLQYPNQVGGYGLIIMAIGICLVSYMVEARHERFGIAGPGNMIIKIFTMLIMLQVALGLINNAGIFPAEIPNIAPTNTQYTNINLQQEMGNINSAGGLTAYVVDITTLIAQTGYSALLLLIKLIISIALFSVVLNGMFPWIAAAGAPGVAFLIAVQFAIWIMYVLFIFTIYFKPSPDPGY